MTLFNKIFGDLIPPGENTNKRNINIKCIFHQDKTASLCISTDENKQVYNCFGCGAKGSWIGFYMKRNGLTYPEAMKQLDMDKPFNKKPVKHPPVIKEEPKRVDTDYSEYIFGAWNKTIMDDEHYAFYGQKLYELRGLTYPTAVACLIGYDPKKGWIFPVCQYHDDKYVGYEIREKYFQMFEFKNGNKTKCYKAPNTPSCLSWVYKHFDNKKAIVCEGFVDAYFMYQYQCEKAQKLNGQDARLDCSILTSSCGVKHMPELVEKAKLWDDFDEVIFVLDNDEAGNLAKEKLAAMEHKDKFRFFNVLKDGEDFEDWYKSTWVNSL